MKKKQYGVWMISPKDLNDPKFIPFYTQCNSWVTNNSEKFNKKEWRHVYDKHPIIFLSKKDAELSVKKDGNPQWNYEVRLLP